MRGVASPAQRQSLPDSLMQRLALVANGEPPPVSRDGSGRPRRRASSLGTPTCFGLGALASVAIGGVTFLGLQALAASETRVDVETGVRPLAKAAPAASWQRPDVFDIAIARGQGAHAPFGLRVAGSENDSVEIVLQGLPAAATLSRGERRDAATWVLRRADLDGLHLSLGDASPGIFDVRIDVLAPPGVPTKGSIARIRVVDAAAPAEGAAAAVEEPPDRRGGSVAGGATSVPKSVPVRAPAAVAGPTATADEKAKPATVERRTAAAPVADASPPASRPWPEGASALGATSRDSERQVWWTLPQPAWSPFQEPARTK